MHLLTELQTIRFANERTKANSAPFEAAQSAEQKRIPEGMFFLYIVVVPKLIFIKELNLKLEGARKK